MQKLSPGEIKILMQKVYQNDEESIELWTFHAI
jgi:hypothetical protein